MTVKAALRWTEEERRCHRLTAALWPTLLEIQNGLWCQFACKRKVWQAGAHMSNTDVPFIMVYFEYLANGRRLNKPPQDGIRKFLRAQAERNGLVLKGLRMSKSSCHAELHLPREVLARIKGGARVVTTRRVVTRKKVSRGDHH